MRRALLVAFAMVLLMGLTEMRVKTQVGAPFVIQLAKPVWSRFGM